MDFTFTMFVLSCGVLIGSYFIYWHIENIITDRTTSLMHDIESLFSGWRSLLREDIDSIKESLEILKSDYGKVRDVVLEEVKKKNISPQVYKPARKTSMKLREKKSSNGDE